MANVMGIKARIKSIKKTRQITNAMKLISIAKLKKARVTLESTLPYFEKIRSTMAEIFLHSAEVSSIYFNKRPTRQTKRVGFVVFTGDQGLAGGYNNDILKFTESKIQSESNIHQGSDHILFVAGHIGLDYFEKAGYNTVKSFNFLVQNPTIRRARDMADEVLKMYVAGEIDEVYVLFTRMVSSIKLVPEIIKILPLDVEAISMGYKDKDLKIDNEFVFEPSSGAVLDVLVPKYVKGILYGCLVEAYTSEQSARVAAMDNATTNADEMLERLNLTFNRARQASITQEILEIVSGAASLE